MSTLFFGTKTGYRSFLTKGILCEDVVYTILCLRNFVRAIYVCIGGTKDNSCNDCMDANFICRGIILWSCLYTTDTGTEKCKSGGGITAFKSGVVFFCTGRLDCAGRKTVNKGNVGMYIDVCCNYPGTGS